MSARQRCLTVGCNPKLPDLEAAAAHRQETGHRTAAWPVRSKEGQRRARLRNKTGYYDKYNVGAKSAAARAHLIPGYEGPSLADRVHDMPTMTDWAAHEDEHPFSSEGLGQD